MKDLTIYTVCGYGLGTSLILKMSLDDILAEPGYEDLVADITPNDVTSAVNMDCDVIFTSPQFHDMVQEANPGVPVVTITDYLDKDAIKQTAIPIMRELASK